MTYRREVAARLRAWPPAWPLPPGPPGRQRLRRSRVGPEDPFCEAVRKDLQVPLTLEGPPRTMRGVPARHCDLAPGDRRTRREQDGPASPRGRGHRGRVAEGTGRLWGAGQLTGGSAAPGGLSPVGRGRLPPRSRRVPRTIPRRLSPALPSRQLAIPTMTSVSSRATWLGHGLARRALARP